MKVAYLCVVKCVMFPCPPCHLDMDKDRCFRSEDPEFFVESTPAGDGSEIWRENLGSIKP